LTTVTNYIKHWEGLRLKLYRCPAGKLTIGYGRNIQDNPLTHDEFKMLYPDLTLSEAMLELPKNGITETGASKLLKDYLVTQSRILTINYGWFRVLNSERKIVVLDMIYNLGFGGFMGFVETVKALKRYDYGKTSIEILDSRYNRQLGDTGEGWQRAEASAYIMRTGKFPDDFGV